MFITPPNSRRNFSDRSISFDLLFRGFTVYNIFTVIFLSEKLVQPVYRIIFILLTCEVRNSKYCVRALSSMGRIERNMQKYKRSTRLTEAISLLSSTYVSPVSLFSSCTVIRKTNHGSN